MSPEAKYPWSVLGLGKMPAEVKDIRRAYARALKQIDQANDIQGFTALRAAYENAVAIREGRDTRNEQSRAREAAAQPKVQAQDQHIPPHPEAPMMEAAPDGIPALPAPSAEQLAALARETAAQALLTALGTENLVQSGGARINQALDNPLSLDPEYADAVRFAVVQIIRSRFRQSEEGGVLSAQIDKDTLLRLDQTYGWLTDFSNFRKDFHYNNNLLDAMATRAYGSLKAPTPPPPRPKTKAGRAWLWAKEHATALTLSYIGLIVGAGMMLPEGKLGVIGGQILLWMILLPILIAVLAVIFGILCWVYVALRGVWRSIARQLRRFQPKL